MEKTKDEKTALTPMGVSVSGIFIILTVATLIVALIFWGISLGRKYQASSIEKKLKSVQEETEGMGEVDAKAKQIYAAEQNLDAINSAKNYWSKFLADFASQTTKNVSLSELSMDEDGTININGVTVSYEALAKLMTSLRDSGNYEDVVLGSATLSSEGSAPITFSISALPKSSALTK